MKEICYRLFDFINVIILWFKRLVRFIFKMLVWSKVIWNDTDWDDSSILKILRFKLIQMSKSFKSKRSFGVDSSDYALAMDKAVSMIDNILLEDFVAEEWSAHESKWGEIEIKSTPCGKLLSRLEVNRPNVITDEDKVLEYQEMKYIYELEDIRRKSAYKELFDYLNQNIRNWWD